MPGTTGRTLLAMGSPDDTTSSTVTTYVPGTAPHWRSVKSIVNLLHGSNSADSNHAEQAELSCHC